MSIPSGMASPATDGLNTLFTAALDHRVCAAVVEWLREEDNP